MKERSPTNQSSNSYQLNKNQLLSKRDFSLAKDVGKELSKTMDHLLKPEEINMPLSNQLTQKKKKKRQRQLPFQT
ncbi:MAG: hypothetical protein ACR2FN_09280 [Chitinophagaceae bacterium]